MNWGYLKLRMSALALCAALSNLLSFAAVVNGSEEGFEWSYDTESRQLSISGSGVLNSAIAQDYQPQTIKLVIGEGITGIGKSAFAYCTNLLDLSLPSTISSLENYTFTSSRLGTIRSNREEPMEIGSSTFYADKDVCVIFVPDGARKFYAKAQNWKDFDMICQGSQMPDAVTGSCGDEATFSIQPGEWTLSVKGKGDIASNSGWSKYSGYIYKVAIDEGITSICDEFCASMTRLSGIDIPSSVLSIGYRAFYGCKFTSIALPNGIKYIGSYAFANSSIASITLPEGLESINDYTFYGSSVEEVSFPSSLQSVGAYAFANTNITTLSLPGNCKSIGANAFVNTGIKTLTIPEGCSRIDKNAFAGCKVLETASLPSSLTSIPSSLFMNCGKLSSVKLPSTLESMGASAFSGAALSGIELPATLTGIGDNAFQNTPLETIDIPASVKSIGGLAFYGCKSLTRCELHEGLESIGTSAFYECEKLGEITLPGTLQNVGDRAFGRSGLKSVAIRDGVESVGMHVFSGCDGIESPIYNSTTFFYLPKEGYAEYVLPKGITAINATGFYGCNSLESVDLSDVKSIGDYAFYDCSSLASINLEGVESIGSQAFYNVGIKTFTLSSSLVNIGEGAFQSCSSLNGTVDLSDTKIVTLGRDMFRDCSKLDIIVLPSTLKTIGNDCFRGCEELESVVLPPLMASIGDNAFMGCESLESVDMPDALTSLGQNAFHGCASLRKVEFREGLTALSNGVFYGCERLKKVVLPQSLYKFDFAAFEGCNRLDSLYFLSEDAPDPMYRGKSSLKGEPIEISQADWNKLPFVRCVIAIPARSFKKWSDWNAAAEKGYFWDEYVFGYKLNYGEYYEKLSGSCGSDGDNVTWKLDTEAGVLRIEGEGAMRNYSWLDYPWYKRSCAILSVEIGEGVTSVGNSAFANYFHLKEIKLPDTMEEIGDNAFCSYEIESPLKAINIPRNVKTIGKMVLEGQNLDVMYVHLKEPIPGTSVFFYHPYSWDPSAVLECRCKTIYVHVGSTELFKSEWETPRTGFYGEYGEYIEKYVDVNVEAGIHGTVTGGGEYEIGDEVTLTAVPDEGFTFQGWSDGSTANPYIFTIGNKDLTIQAVFSGSGDANGDGNVNAADIVEVVNAIMGNSSDEFNSSAADMNGDGVVNAADIVEIVNAIMKAK